MLSPPPAVTGSARRARWAVAALFFLNGAVYANLVPRLPEIKSSLELSNAALGTAIAAVPIGALAAGPLAPAMIRTWGSGRVAAIGMACLATSVALVPFAWAWPALAAAFLAVGASDSVADVGQNTHGFRVQRLYGRSLMNTFHALWSVGAVAGGLLGAAAAAASIPLTLHVGIATAAFVAVALAALRNTLPGADPARDEGPPATQGRPRERAGPRTIWMLAALGVLAACEAFVQDAGSSWGALFLADELGVAAGLAGAAFVAMQTAMTAGRLAGDPLVDRFGQRRIARLGGAVVAVGMSIGLLWPSPATAILGFALAGLGVATLYPAVMHTADELPGLGHGVGIAVVSWLLRVGFLLSPIVLGILADQIGLAGALWTMVAAGLIVAVVGRVLLRSAASRGPLTA